jgi:hypothetical protein
MDLAVINFTHWENLSAGSEFGIVDARRRGGICLADPRCLQPSKFNQGDDMANQQNQSGNKDQGSQQKQGGQGGKSGQSGGGSGSQQNQGGGQSGTHSGSKSR